MMPPRAAAGWWSGWGSGCWLRRCGVAAREFAEQPAGLAVPYARKTPLLAGQLAAIAAELAGRAGARLARVLAVEVSRHTLVRVLMALPAGRGAGAGAGHR